MKILMTGSHGFVGTNLLEALSAKHEIIRWDARVDQPLTEVDAVIHLAGLAHDTKHTTEADAYFKVNTLLTQQIYDRFLESSAKKFIFFSSIKAQDGDTPYALSKKKAEEYIVSKGITTAKRAYILRPCMIHGKGVKGNLPLLYNVVKTGLPWPLAAFENKRSYASIGNVRYVVSKLLNKDVESGIYPICDDTPVSTNELIKIIFDCLGKKAKFWRIPRGMIVAFAKLGDVLHLPLNSERLGKLTENYVVNNDDIKRTLDIESMPIKAVDGLKSTINYMIDKQ
jgi:nucleoside-diphosphate-sugar epimerase